MNLSTSKLVSTTQVDPTGLYTVHSLGENSRKTLPDTSVKSCRRPEGLALIKLHIKCKEIQRCRALRAHLGDHIVSIPIGIPSSTFVPVQIRRQVALLGRYTNVMLWPSKSPWWLRLGKDPWRGIDLEDDQSSCFGKAKPASRSRTLAIRTGVWLFELDVCNQRSSTPTAGLGWLKVKRTMAAGRQKGMYNRYGAFGSPSVRHSMTGWTIWYMANTGWMLSQSLTRSIVFWVDAMARSRKFLSKPWANIRQSSKCMNLLNISTFKLLQWSLFKTMRQPLLRLGACILPSKASWKGSLMLWILGQQAKDQNLEEELEAGPVAKIPHCHCPP